MKCTLDDNTEYRLEGRRAGVDCSNVTRHVKAVVLGLGGVIGYSALHLVLLVRLPIWRTEKCPIQKLTPIDC